MKYFLHSMVEMPELTKDIYTFDEFIEMIKSTS